MEFNNAFFKEFRNELEVFNKTLSEKHGIILDIGAMTYNNTEFTFKTSAKIGGSIEEVEKREFNRYCRNYGFAPSDYGHKIVVGKFDHTFIGFKPRATKMVCLIRQNSNGKIYKVSIQTIERNLNI